MIAALRRGHTRSWGRSLTFLNRSGWRRSGPGGGALKAVSGERGFELDGIFIRNWELVLLDFVRGDQGYNVASEVRGWEEDRDKVLDFVAKPRQVDRCVGGIRRNRWLSDDLWGTLEHTEKLLGGRRVGEGAHPGDLRSMMRQSVRDLLGLVVVRVRHFEVLGKVCRGCCSGGVVVGKGWHREQRVL